MTSSTSRTSSRTPDGHADTRGTTSRLDRVLVPSGWPEGVGAVFTTRHGGVSGNPYASLNLGAGVGDEPAAVTQNRHRVARHVGVPDDRLLFMRQVHGPDVAIVDGPWPVPGGRVGDTVDESVGPGEPPPVDALVTATRGLALAVLVADCVPVLLADPGHGVVGVAHAGRAGMVAGVVPAALARMRELGARDIVAVLGPAVCGSCYELSADLADSVARTVPAAAAKTRTGRPAADVPAGVRAQLDDAGVRLLPWAAPCTVENPHQFSHRRDRVTGRAAGVVWLP